MLVHLDGRLNDVGRRNENFAREFFELYTIGKGQQVGTDDYSTFTEQDVIEASKVLSGNNTDWTYTSQDPETEVSMDILRGSVEVASNHDASIKQFSDRFQQATIQPNQLIWDKATKEAALDELDQLVNMIFAQEAAARHICRRLYRFFVYYDITEQIEQDIIGPLAQTFMVNVDEIKPVLEQLFRSIHFFVTDNSTEIDDNRGGIIKSPLEVVLGALRFFNVQLPDQNIALGSFYETNFDLLRKLRNQGLDFYEPFEVAGYQAYHQAPACNRNWITSNNLARRYQISTDLLLGQKDENDSLLYQIDILAYGENESVDVNSPQAIVNYLLLQATMTGYLIQLHGGNDGLNTVMPLDQYTEYYNLRPNLAIPYNGKRKYIDLDNTLITEDQIGLHPDFIHMKELYDQAKVNIVQNVAYENVNGSHFRSRDIWFMVGNYDEYLPSGWMGRYLDHQFPGYPDEYPNTDMPDSLAIEIGNGISLAFHRSNGIPTAISIQNPEQFYDLISSVGGMPPEYIANTHYSQELQWIMDIEEKSNQYAGRLKEVFEQGANSQNVTYPELYPYHAPSGRIRNRLVPQLRMIARLLSGGVKTKISLARLGGFDTHAEQVEP